MTGLAVNPLEMNLPGRLLVVTDRTQARKPLTTAVAEMVGAGTRWVWLRDRDLPADERRGLAHELAAITRAAGAALSIGDDIALAAETGAAGVHLRSVADIAMARRMLAAGTLIGVSTHSVEEVREAALAGADYVTLSPIFISMSKPGYGPALGLDALRQASAMGVPVIALGGINALRVGPCRRAGAHGIAVMGAVMRSAAPAIAARRMLAPLRRLEGVDA